MVTEVEMTVWIQSMWSCETVKDQNVDEAHGKSEGVYSKGGVLYGMLKYCIMVPVACCALSSQISCILLTCLYAEQFCFHC